MTVRPMRPTIAAANIRIGITWRTTEAPLPVRLQALAAQHAKASEEKLDRDCENRQPRKSDEDPARYVHPGPPQTEQS